MTIAHGVDSDEVPAERTDDNGNSEGCLNCGHMWTYHHGWQCVPCTLKGPAGPPEMRRSKLPADKCYLTPDMTFPASTVPHSVSKKAEVDTLYHELTQGAEASQRKDVSKDVSDWRTWAHNKEGECACGIPKAACTYHGG